MNTRRTHRRGQQGGAKLTRKTKKSSTRRQKSIRRIVGYSSRATAATWRSKKAKNTIPINVRFATFGNAKEEDQLKHSIQAIESLFSIYDNTEDDDIKNNTYEFLVIFIDAIRGVVRKDEGAYRLYFEDSMISTLLKRGDITTDNINRKYRKSIALLRSLHKKLQKTSDPKKILDIVTLVDDMNKAIKNAIQDHTGLHKNGSKSKRNTNMENVSASAKSSSNVNALLESFGTMGIKNNSKPSKNVDDLMEALKGLGF
jgi:hypothetical protein